ncbi:MAG: hypothetical protein BWY52_02095 [Chloroflexi bacterium ADurb.Bin325]|nr:MAG: hypothetical protein BWY52_02095 [Chloroflexi bacterium ADurb.Bin325]
MTAGAPDGGVQQMRPEPACGVLPSWAPKVSQAKIRRLYLADARGAVDEALIDEVGWGLWSRCDSILSVTAAHYGRVACPVCGAAVLHTEEGAAPPDERCTPWRDGDIVECGGCGWRLPWSAYHRTYQGKQLFGANAVEAFAAYHRAFPRAAAPRARMLLIDRLIHEFHTGLTELGRPVGANLIEGTLKSVIRFLDDLTSGPESAAGLDGSRAAWRAKMESAAWVREGAWFSADAG